MLKSETSRIESYLRKKFKTDSISVAPREDDVAESSADVRVGKEDIGVVYKDTEDGEVCYHFQMPILDEDLEPAGDADMDPD